MRSIHRNTECVYNTTTIQMGFRRKSNDLFENESQEFSLLIYTYTVYGKCSLKRFYREAHIRFDLD